VGLKVCVKVKVGFKFMCKCDSNGKGKVVPDRALNMCRGSRGTIPLSLNFETQWRCVDRFTLWPLDARVQEPPIHF